MKQGSTKTVQSGHHVEPKSHSINPMYVAQMGQMQGNHITGKGDIPFSTESLHQGQTLAAPECKTTQHHSGSQGKH
jgi:hypothetical protein